MRFYSKKGPKEKKMADVGRGESKNTKREVISLISTASFNNYNNVNMFYCLKKNIIVVWIQSIKSVSNREIGGKAEKRT